MGCGDNDVAIVSPPTGPAHPSRGRTSRSSGAAPPREDPAASGVVGTLVGILKGAAVTSLVIADIVGIAKDMLNPTFLDNLDLAQQWSHVREMEDRD